MRKLLLGTTALAAAATFSANVALADISISGYYEWRYESRSSNITAKDGTQFASDSEIKFLFSNKTDSGLDVSLKTEVLNDGGDSAVQESAIYISGGFGKIQLGSDDGINDGSIPIASNDLISEEMYSTSTITAGDGKTNLGIKDGDMANLAGNDNKVAYYLPAMGGLTAGAAFTDSGEEGTADTTEFGAGYSMEAGGASVYLSYVTGTTENATQDIDSSAIGVKVATGDITFVIGQSQYEAENDDEQGTSAAVKFNVSDGMTLAAYTGEVEDDISLEEYSNSGAELIYTIASGLKAIVTIEDYDYKKGTGAGAGTVDDSGTHSKLTMKATF
jgi:outer membrane protein OmpU